MHVVGQRGVVRHLLPHSETDDLASLADFAEEQEIHFLMEAAWRSPALLSNTLRKKMTGIERADRITIDGHKQLFVPKGSGVLMLKNPEHCRFVAVTGVSVTSEVEADWRGLAGYPVKFQIQNVLKLIVREFDIPRNAEELSTLDSQVRLKLLFSVPGNFVLPETFSIDSLSAYTNVSMTTDTLQTFQLFEDLATINFKDCFEIKKLKDMTTLPIVSEARLVAFRPVPRSFRAQRRCTSKIRRPSHR